MGKTVSPEQFGDALKDILTEYRDDVTEGVSKSVESTAKYGQKSLKATSPKRKGKYARGWKVKLEKKRLYTVATLYNARPGLPHLLEHGHVTRNGKRTYGRTPAHPHIAEVEQTTIEMFERAVREVITQ